MTERWKKKRLIDANELVIHPNSVTVNNEDMTISGAVDIVDILEAPTVEAIPIDWLKDYVDSGVSDDIFQRNRRFVLNMIKDWEKENDR